MQRRCWRNGRWRRGGFRQRPPRRNLERQSISLGSILARKSESFALALNMVPNWLTRDWADSLNSLTLGGGSSILEVRSGTRQHRGRLGNACTKKRENLAQRKVHQLGRRETSCAFPCGELRVGHF